MKRRLITPILAIMILIPLLAVTASAVIPGNTVYRISRELADNLQYVNTVSWDSTDGRGESFVLRYNKGGGVYPIALKDETIYGPLTITDAVSYAERMGKNVIAAFNSDFFAPQTGVPFGIVVEEGVYKSSPEGRNAVSFSGDGGVNLHRDVQVDITLENQGGPNGMNGGKTVSLTHFNKFRADTGGLYLFSEHFSTVSTRTVSEGWFVRFKILAGTPSVEGTMVLEVVERLTAVGEVEIGSGYLLLSAAIAGGYGEQYDKFAVGDIVTLTTKCSDSVMINAKYATGAGEPLITNGVPEDTSHWDELMQKRSPRTAIGIKADGTVICYMIDGRDMTQSVGLIPRELVDEMLRQGCVSALNLDGGGSTALSIRMPGKDSTSLINRPSDGTERKCGTYIFFVTDAVSDGKASVLALENDGAVVLSGSSIELKYAASDKGYKKAPVPGDVNASPALYGSTAAQGVYTAGGMAGTDTIALTSLSTGAGGMGNIVVITEPTSLTITEPESTDKLTGVTLSPGQELGIGLIATYYRRSVTAQALSFDYEITGDIVQMLEPGVFKASYTPSASGTITVSAGGTKAVLQVEIKGFDDMTEHWARDYVGHLSSTGVVKGISETEYGPELEIRRGDFILMLYRASGEPETLAEVGFDDVEHDAYFAQAIAWARENGIAAGVGDGLFEPLSPLTRQQAFTFVYRTLDMLGIAYESGDAADTEPFFDADLIAEYALIPAATLIKLGVVEGSDGYLTPEDGFTRAQMAKVLSVVLRLPKAEVLPPVDAITVPDEVLQEGMDTVGEPDADTDDGLHDDDSTEAGELSEDGENEQSAEENGQEDAAGNEDSGGSVNGTDDEMES